MMYDHESRYRCTIIRGKAQTDIESLIPIYASIIVENEGLDRDSFNVAFNAQLAPFIASPTKKTLDNHRTEIACKLYGMYFFADGKLCVAPRTKKVDESQDLPAFFKSIITYFQFPNGMDAIQTIRKRVDDGIKIRPYHFILSILKLAEQMGVNLTKREIAYYVLDSLDVLKGIASPEEVFKVIAASRESGIERFVEYPGKASSYGMQHISEQLNILELSNLIGQYSEGHEKVIKLNSFEKVFIDSLTASDYSNIPFDVYKYGSDFGRLRDEWQEFYCLEPLSIAIPDTSTDALFNQTNVVSGFSSSSPLEVGDEGEKIVFDNEKLRVSEFNQRLSQQKVLLLGKQRGLGYDIQSVWACQADMFGKEADAAFYIEVKSTKRTTKPNMGVSDKVVLTRNEWLTANKFKEDYAIFRVYLTSKGVFVYKIFNPLEAKALCVPIQYNYEFNISGELESWKLIG